MTAEEWACIRGHHGTLLGLGLSEKTFTRMLRCCKTKKALMLRGDAERCKEYLQAVLVQYGKTALKKEMSRRAAAAAEGEALALALEKHAKATVEAAKKKALRRPGGGISSKNK